MQQEHPPSFFDQLLEELQRLCRENNSGTLFVTTDDSHSARFALKEGVIVSIGYRTKSGLDAIPFIREIRGGTYSFSNANVFMFGATSARLPDTPEIFRLLGIVPAAPDPQSVPARPSITVRSIPFIPRTPPVTTAPATTAPATTAPATTRPAVNPSSTPVIREPSTRSAPAPRTSAISAATGRRLPPAKKILVVEDSTTTRKVIVKILVDGGYTVLEAENGLAAFAQLSETNPDLILLDIVMPGIDGYKVLSMLRKHDTFKNLPVIMLTSRDGLLDKLRGKMGGSDEYLTKPFTAEQLLAKVSKYLVPDQQ